MTYGRRDLLQRLGLSAGAWLLGPLVTGLVREARGQATGRKILFTLVQGNGFVPRRHTPVVRSETDFDLPASLAPFEPWRRNVTIITPLDHPTSRELHGNGLATLQCVPELVPRNDDTFMRPGGISLDRAIAKVIGRDDPVSSLNLAIYHKTFNGGGQYFPHQSADGPDKPYPPEWNPTALFDKVFAQPARAAGLSAEELFDRDKSVLDFVRGDLAALQLRLAGPEREKLGQFTESLRTLEQQLAPRQRGGGSCQAPSRPTGTFAIQREISGPTIEALVDVAAQAIACGMTRVVTLSLHGVEGPDNPWPFLNVKNPHLHSHDDDHVTMTRLEQYCFGRAAQLLQRLTPFREGAGTLADQTLVMCVNAGGGEHHGGSVNHAVVLVGNAGGGLRAGRAMVIPPRSRTVADVYCAVATAVGAPMSTFGVAAHCKGPMPGLLA